MGSPDSFCYRGGEKPQEGIDKPSNEQTTSYFPSTLLCLRHPDSQAIGATRSSHATLQTSSQFRLVFLACPHTNHSDFFSGVCMRITA
jgi:hypothetical protein